MSKPSLLIFPLCFVVLFVGCAKDVLKDVDPLGKTQEKGTVIISFSAPVSGVTATLDDVLQIEKAFTTRIELKNVPSGQHKIRVTANASNYKEQIDATNEVNVETNKEKTVLISVPPLSVGYWVYTSIAYACMMAILITIDLPH